MLPLRLPYLAPSYFLQPSTHKFFPDAFRDLSKALLLSHHRSVAGLSTDAAESRATAKMKEVTRSDTRAVTRAEVCLPLNTASPSPLLGLSTTSVPFDHSAVSTHEKDKAPRSSVRLDSSVRVSNNNGSIFHPHSVSSVKHPCAMPVTSSLRLFHLAKLPLEIVMHILSFCAPPQSQCISNHPGGVTDILPALLPSDPATWPSLQSNAG